jgi:hypothetical protein
VAGPFEDAVGGFEDDGELPVEVLVFPVDGVLVFPVDVVLPELMPLLSVDLEPGPEDAVDPVLLLLLLLLGPADVDPLGADDFDPTPLVEDELGPEDVFEETLPEIGDPPVEDVLDGPELPPGSDD